MRFITPEAIDALGRGDAIVSAAVGILSPDPVRVWGGHGPFSISGAPYQGLGDRMLIDVTNGALGGGEQNISVTLSGIEPDVAPLIEAPEVMGAGAMVYRLIFNGAGTQLLDGQIYKRGRVDDIAVEETVGGESTVTGQIESAARGLGRNNGRMRSDADQRLIDPIDGFFKHCAYAGEKQVYFGGKISSAAKTVS